jgi:hypothetical protein
VDLTKTPTQAIRPSGEAKATTGSLLRKSHSYPTTSAKVAYQSGRPYYSKDCAGPGPPRDGNMRGRECLHTISFSS